MLDTLLIFPDSMDQSSLKSIVIDMAESVLVIHSDIWAFMASILSPMEVSALSGARWAISEEMEALKELSVCVTLVIPSWVSAKTSSFISPLIPSIVLLIWDVIPPPATYFTLFSIVAALAFIY